MHIPIRIATAGAADAGAAFLANPKEIEGFADITIDSLRDWNATPRNQMQQH
jgi:hypothetical protein